jgi:hypothetical protein
MKFFCINSLGMKCNESNCLSYIEQKKFSSLPVIILFRDSTWNDYGYVTHFSSYYIHEDKEIKNLGWVKIIQSDAPDGKTTLPEEFEKLDEKEFFSRGLLQFYTNLNQNEFLKQIILDSLNDIHYKRYLKKDILKIDENLEAPYNYSLFRSDVRDLNVSSEYAKNALETLKKIQTSTDSLIKIDEENRDIILKLLFGSVITTLESYLGDAFKYNVINKKAHFHSFLLNYDFKSEKKYTLKELGKEKNRLPDFLEIKVKEIMENIIFHKLTKVSELYSNILLVDLDLSLMDFLDDVQKRHDIFHRNGKNANGVDIEIDNMKIFQLITKVEDFISKTEKIISAQTN